MGDDLEARVDRLELGLHKAIECIEKLSLIAENNTNAIGQHNQALRDLVQSVRVLVAR